MSTGMKNADLLLLPVTFFYKTERGEDNMEHLTRMSSGSTFIAHNNLFQSQRISYLFNEEFVLLVFIL